MQQIIGRTAIALNCLGSVAAREGNYAVAYSLHEQSLALCQQSAVKDGIAQSLRGLADLARLRGDHGSALLLSRQSLTMWRELDEKPEFLEPLEYVGALLRARGQHDRAVRLWAVAQALREVLSIRRSASDTDEYRRNISAARAALGDAEFAVTWAQGQGMGADQAIEYALQDESGPTLQP